MLTNHQQSPFVYVIGWTDLNLWYLGVKFSKDCSTVDLWTTYFTSSFLVAEVREFYGEPDHVEILATGNASDMRHLEMKLIKEFRLHHDSRWLNRCSRIACDPAFMKGLWADPHQRAKRTEKIRATITAKYGKRYELNGVWKTAHEWAKEYPNVTAQQIRCRLTQGWSLVDALTITPRRRRKKSIP